MRFYYLSTLQKLDLSFVTLMFCIFIGFLRPLLPAWHKLEREIGNNIKKKILAKSLNYTELKSLDNIKGYREVRYLLAEEK